ncbi:hypothetical protein BJ741DRAFT_609389 [Chytriomyces cf. hyalinus JEL632]|nr:hypothetical protein BJ741DRAFT_609389 [Chytriomyces cf. hyalinus JEL632]
MAAAAPITVNTGTSAEGIEYSTASGRSWRGGLNNFDTSSLRTASVSACAAAAYRRGNSFFTYFAQQDINCFTQQITTVNDITSVMVDSSGSATLTLPNTDFVMSFDVEQFSSTSVAACVARCRPSAGCVVATSRSDNFYCSLKAPRLDTSGVAGWITTPIGSIVLTTAVSSTSARMSTTTEGISSVVATTTAEVSNTVSQSPYTSAQSPILSASFTSTLPKSNSPVGDGVGGAVNSGPSIGLIAGIVAGVIVLLAIIGLYLLRQRNLQKKPIATATAPHDSSYHNPNGGETFLGANRPESQANSYGSFSNGEPLRPNVSVTTSSQATAVSNSQRLSTAAVLKASEARRESEFLNQMQGPLYSGAPLAMNAGENVRLKVDVAATSAQLEKAHFARDEVSPLLSRNVHLWSVQETATWASHVKGLSINLADIFRANNINGELLFSLNSGFMQEMGIASVTDRIRLQAAINELPGQNGGQGSQSSQGPQGSQDPPQYFEIA